MKSDKSMKKAKRILKIIINLPKSKVLNFYLMMISIVHTKMKNCLN